MNDLKRLIIVGAGSHGLELYDIVRDINLAKPTFDLIGFVDDGAVNNDRLVARGMRILGPLEVLSGFDAMFVLGIGHPVVRTKIADRIAGLKLKAATLIHPTVSRRSFVNIGSGTVIYPYVTL